MLRSLLPLISISTLILSIVLSPLDIHGTCFIVLFPASFSTVLCLFQELLSVLYHVVVLVTQILNRKRQIKNDNPLYWYQILVIPIVAPALIISNSKDCRMQPPHAIICKSYQPSTTRTSTTFMFIIETFPLIFQAI